jgi:hypothetical protein
LCFEEKGGRKRGEQVERRTAEKRRGEKEK